ncbi:hypothetical protein TWF225_001495 [Orbilia oligospora]|uniref:Uncharacterized protein n=1 Tax=Orbilia oligospora TaxID=2813651 RepID=A0A7C8PUZ5_ORBOL|nr:hypothetical protein TWF751_010879 [Orbilia oligospora]KAF3191358.1 hypothetical protein TWF225_001495 [Orbilia oligospora]KAF3267824.1 hypothetical protein TWF217_011555 [Orbilia oligospora]KAF3269544.1 hypothetical protein TWF128_005752 [Orbilia oligospora]KAF3296560.1 hypothetical protein TWF132_010152 [Orbilia oligospora]
MLGVLLAFYATSVVASPSGSKLTNLHRRMEVQARPDMAKDQYTPGKIPVTFNMTDSARQKMGWIAHVGISGEKYGLMLDNMISTTWLYSPTDKNKCEMEMKGSREGMNYCYMMKTGDKMLDGVQPFMLNFTGPGGYGVSGTRAVVTTVSCPEMDGGAKFPVAAGLVDNTYIMGAGGAPPEQHMYHGVLGLSKMDTHVFELGEKKEHIYQTPFQASSGWDYFTTYFNHKADDDKTYIGLQYMDEAAKMGELTTIASVGDQWSVTADATWKVKVWEQNVMVGDENAAPEVRFNHPFPAVNMSQTANIHLDLASGTTFVDLDTAKAIYKAFDGSCNYYPVPGWKNERLPLCTFPVEVFRNRTSGEEWVMPTKAGKVSLPFGKADVQIIPDTMIDLVDGPCFHKRGRMGKGHYGAKVEEEMGDHEGEMGMDEGYVGGDPATRADKRDMGGKDGKDGKMSGDMMPEVESCYANAYGKVQPNVFDTKADQNKMYWKYGDVFFKNAFVKWTAGASPSIGVAEYAAMPGAMVAAPNGNKRGGNGKKRTMVRYRKHLPQSEM